MVINRYIEKVADQILKDRREREIKDEQKLKYKWKCVSAWICPICGEPLKYKKRFLTRDHVVCSIDERHYNEEANYYYGID